MLCQCEGRPRCEMPRCDAPADWSVILPPWPPRSRCVKFYCDWHYREMRKPIPGIDRPAHADESWRPNLTDCLRLASIHATPASVQAPLPPPGMTGYWQRYAERFTPAQRAQFEALRGRHDPR